MKGTSETRRQPGGRRLLALAERELNQTMRRLANAERKATETEICANRDSHEQLIAAQKDTDAKVGGVCYWHQENRV